MRSVVVLPAPFGPSRPVTPAVACSDTPSTAVVRWNLRTRPVASIVVMSDTSGVVEAIAAEVCGERGAHRHGGIHELRGTAEHGGGALGDTHAGDDREPAHRDRARGAGGGGTLG